MNILKFIDARNIIPFRDNMDNFFDNLTISFTDYQGLVRDSYHIRREECIEDFILVVQRKKLES